MDRKIEKVLGYNVDLLSFDDAIDIVSENMRNFKGMHIVTINPEIIELANNNTFFSQIIKNADMVIPDGSGIKLALSLRGIEQEQIPGIDFAKELLKVCADFHYRVALVGAKEKVIQTAVDRINAEFDDIDICYFHNGYFTKDKEEEIVKQVADSNPRFVLVALGAPKQDFFIKKCKEYMPRTVFIGVGGSFDVWAGEVDRAPEFFRTMGCEWIYRTYKQPERIKRIYKTLPAFLFKVIIEALKKKGKK